MKHTETAVKARMSEVAACAYSSKTTVTPRGGGVLYIKDNVRRLFEKDSRVTDFIETKNGFSFSVGTDNVLVTVIKK